MKKIIPIIVALIVVAGGSFYGGLSYQKSKNSPGNFSRQNFQNLSEEERQQLFQGNVGGAIQRGVGRGAGAGFLNGEVIAKDSQSLTLKMMDGSSKIIFFSDSTQISKTAEGTVNDVEIGKEIMVTGQQNSDGSYTAQAIQLSPRSMIR
ncbi:MAG: hypothetical protein Q8P63_01545 [Candidatus Nealsonbacteria bacterium]|nr:hypothetical protein [Candidatus Nealsonbacteria bacterium]